MSDKEEILKKLETNEVFLQKHNGKSEVWQYFSDVVDKNNFHLSFIQCNKCKNLFSYNIHITGTTTLRRHLLVCDKIINLKKERSIDCTENNQDDAKLNILEAPVAFCADDLRPFIVFDDNTMKKFEQTQKLLEKEDVIKKLNNGTYITKVVEGKSEVWNYFSSIINAETKSLINYVKCNKCSNIYTYMKHKTGTTFLQKHRIVCASRSSQKPVKLKGKVKLEIKRSWTRQDIRNLIAEYKSRNYLWDPSFVYKHKEERVNAVKELAITFKTTEKDIKNKLKNFKYSFIRECRKVKENRLTDTSYVSDWPFFKYLTFLQKGKYFKTHRMQTEVEEDSKLGIAEDFGITNSIFGPPVDHFSHPLYDNSPLKDVFESIHLVEDANSEILTDNSIFSSSESNKHDLFRNNSAHDSSYAATLSKSINQTDRNLDEFLRKSQDPDDIFGAYIAYEMRNLQSKYLRKKMKRMMQEVVLDITQEDEDFCNSLTNTPSDISYNITLLNSP